MTRLLNITWLALAIPAVVAAVWYAWPRDVGLAILAGLVGVASIVWEVAREGKKR